MLRSGRNLPADCRGNLDVPVEVIYTEGMTSTEMIGQLAGRTEQRQADLALVGCDRATALRMGYTVEMIVEAEGRLAS